MNYYKRKGHGSTDLSLSDNQSMDVLFILQHTHTYTPIQNFGVSSIFVILIINSFIQQGHIKLIKSDGDILSRVGFVVFYISRDSLLVM